MNKTFKVARSLTRGTVVTSEAASSRQGKALKTVVAAVAAALVGGAAVAAESETLPWSPINGWQAQAGITDAVISGKVTADNLKQQYTSSGDKLVITNGAEIKIDANKQVGIAIYEDGREDAAKGVIEINGGKVAVGDTTKGGIQAKALTLSGGEVTIKNTTAANNWGLNSHIGGEHSFAMTGGTLNIEAGGRVWAGEGAKKEYPDMVFSGGVVNMNGTAENQAIITTMTYGSFGTPGNKPLYQTMLFSGAQVDVKGNALMLSRDIQVTGGVIKVEKEGSLTLLAEKQLEETTNKPLTSHTSNTFSEGSVTVDGGAIDVVKGGTLKVVHDDFNLESGNVTNAGTFTANAINVNGGKLVNTNALVADSLTVEGGVVETVYNWTAQATTTAAEPAAPAARPTFDKDFQVATVNLNGGVLKLVQTSDNKGLVLNDGEWNLNGGVLAFGSDSAYTGDVKIGRADAKATVTIGDGASYKFNKIAFGSSNYVQEQNAQSTLTIEEDSTLNVGTLDFTTGLVTVEGTLSADTLVHKYDVKNFAHEGSLTVEKTGTLATAGKNIFTKGEAADAKWELTEAAKNLKGTGIVEVSGKTEFTLDELTKAQALLNGTENANSLQVVFANSQLKLGENEKLTGDKVQGLVLAGYNGEATNNGFSVNNAKDTVLSGIDYSKAETAAESVTITTTGEGALVLTGDANQGNIFKFKDAAKTTTVTATGKLTLGTGYDDAGIINVDTLNADTLNVAGQFTGHVVNVTEAGQIDGMLDVKKLSITNGKTATIGQDGLLVADQVSGGTVKVSGGAVLALNERQVKMSEIVNPAAKSDAQTPDYIDQVASAVDAREAGSFVVTDAKNGVAKATKAMADAGFAYDETKHAVLYVDKTLSVAADSGSITLGNRDNGNLGSAGNVTVGANQQVGVVVVDAMNFLNKDAQAINGQLVMNSQAAIVLGGLNATGTIQLATSGNNQNFGNFVDGNILFNEELVSTVKGADGKDKSIYGVKVTFNEAAVQDYDELSEALKTHLTVESDAKLRNLLVAVGNTGTGLLNDTKTALSDKGEGAVEEIFATPAVSGVYNVAYDAAEQVNATLARRNVEPTTGMGVWADVFYSANEAKKIYNGEQGYSTDIYGGMIGFDTVFSCGAKLGAALTIGTGDTDSEKSVSKFSTDSDFYGLSVYTGKNLGDTSIYLSADASYLWVDNDVSTKVAGYSESESIDSNVFTIGARADWRAYEGDVLQVTPHFGMRYTAIDADDYLGLESDSMNVFELPIGVKVAGNFETNGVKIAPAFDFTVVPQVGDTQVNTLLGDVDVIDDLYNAALGVEATTGNFTFGLSYKYGFGKDDRSNNSFNANVRYTF